MVEDGSYLIEVEDDGPGVAPEERDRIFEPFFSKRPGGTGLGLSVAAGIVRAHGGTIEVTAGDRGGARFRVVLPGAEGTGGEASECPLDEAEGEVPS
jgi:signal transduction histidine kinase